MSNLLQAFSKLGGFALFLVLEVICFALIIRFNDYQQQVALSSANKYMGSLSGTVDELEDYLHLNEEVERLRSEVARLRSAENNAMYRDLDTSFARFDTIAQQYIYIDADVINKTFLGRNNYITLNRGRKHGIEPNMGVVDDLGIVGVVAATSTYHSKVMTIFHQDARISAKLKGTGLFGSLMWRDNDFFHMSLEDIPTHHQPHLGDTVLTSGYSILFPPDIMIGVIDHIGKEPGAYSHQLKVKLNNDLRTIHFAYVINNLMKDDLSELEEE
ncbi:MAG: rod shape-determining protein MreC [Saprospiraceae bacterium]